MKYIIMCGGEYKQWKTPRQLTRIGNETLVERTIRLLRENGVDDIAISSNDDRFSEFGVPVLKHENEWTVFKAETSIGIWCNCFYPMKEPVCYLMGDVVFSNEAIKKIVETETDDIEFFASAPPFASNYVKPYAEPFGFKVVNNEHLKVACNIMREYDKQHKFNRHPIAWELWQIIKNTPINVIDYTNYTIINDYTCDIDCEQDITKFKDKGVF